MEGKWDWLPNCQAEDDRLEGDLTADNKIIHRSSGIGRSFWIGSE
jgi:hypothetical protein